MYSNIWLLEMRNLFGFFLGFFLGMLDFVDFNDVTVPFCQYVLLIPNFWTEAAKSKYFIFYNQEILSRKHWNRTLLTVGLQKCCCIMKCSPPMQLYGRLEGIFLRLQDYYLTISCEKITFSRKTQLLCSICAFHLAAFREDSQSPGW